MRRHQPRTTNHLRRVALVLLVVGTAATATAQEPFRGEQIAVVPFQNLTGDDQWDALAAAMTETIRLTLAIDGQYRVRDVAEIDAYAADAPVRLREAATDARLDGIVFGRIARTAEGRFELESSLYGAEVGWIVGSQTREAFGTFDLLDAADELILVSMGALVGYAVDFGALRFEPLGGDAPYRVTIDGVAIGDNVTAAPQVPAGSRRVDVEALQDGTYQFVYSAMVDVRPGEAQEIAFALPSRRTLSPGAVQRLHRVASALLDSGAPLVEAEAALEEADRLLGDALDRFPDLARERERIVRRIALEREFRQLDIGAYGAGEDPALLRRRVGLAEEWVSRSGDPVLASIARRTMDAHLHLIRLGWIHRVAQGDWDEADAYLSEFESASRMYDSGLAQRAREDRRLFDSARSGFSRLLSRWRRPLPWIVAATGIGAGVASISGLDAELYEWADGRGLIPEVALTVPVSAAVVEFAIFTVGAYASGVAATRIARNFVVDEGYTEAWIAENYARLASIAQRVFEADDSEALALIVGTEGTVRTPDTLELLPALVAVERGRPLSISRAPVVSTDLYRPVTVGLTVIPVR